MGEVKYWDGEDFTILDSKNAKSVNGIKFRINENVLEYSDDGSTWSPIDYPQGWEEVGRD